MLIYAHGNILYACSPIGAHISVLFYLQSVSRSPLYTTPFSASCCIPEFEFCNIFCRDSCLTAFLLPLHFCLRASQIGVWRWASVLSLSGYFSSSFTTAFLQLLLQLLLTFIHLLENGKVGSQAPLLL